MGVEPVLTDSGARRTLRKLELEAYAAVVSAFRAQGPLTRDKKSSLDFLSKLLGISTERHRAEIRRAVNDELLGSVAGCLTGYETEKAWRKEGQKLATTNPRFVSRPATHIPQVLTAATLSAAGGGVGGGGIKPGAATTTKPTPTPGQSTEADLKKAISIQLQNALKLVMSQNPTATSVATGRSTLTPQDGKTLTTTLRPQSAPVTPVKAQISSTVTSSPSKIPATSSVVSPLKAGTVASKTISAKVVASSGPRKNISVGTNPPTSVVAVTLTAAKPTKSGSPSLDGASKKSKLSAIESLLCEETISPKSSPGPAPSPGVVKDEVPATPPDPTSVKKAEISKTETEKTQVMEEAVSQKVEPPVDSQKVKQPDSAIEESENKSDPKLPTDNVETKPDSVQDVESKVTDDVEAKPTADKLLSQDVTVQKEISSDASEKNDDKTDTKAKPQAGGSSDAATEEQSSTPQEDSTLKQNVNEIAPVTDNEMVKTESMTTLSADVEISRPANIELSKPLPPLSLPVPTTTTHPEEDDVTVKKGTRKRSPSPSLSESDQPPPAKKQAIALQQDVVARSPSPTTISAGQPPSAKGQAVVLQSSGVVPLLSSDSTSGQPPLAQKQTIAAHKGETNPPTGVSDLPPPAKKQAIDSQKEVITPSVFTSTPAALLSTPTATTTAQASIPVTGTSTVTVTVLGSSVDMGSTNRDTTGFDITPPSSQLPTEVNTDSLIQSLCSDSTSFEDPPDVSVLASQLGIDSIDSPVFNLSGFLSLIQPDLSVLTPEDPTSASGGGKLLGGDISSGEKQSSVVTGPLLGDISGSEEQSSVISDQLLGPGEADQKSSKGTMEENMAEATTGLLATQTLPVGVSSPLQPKVADPIPSAVELPIASPTQELPTTSSTSAPPVSLPPTPVVESIAASTMSVLSPVVFPEEPILPRPLVLEIPTDTPAASLSQAPPAPPPPLLGTPITPPPLTPTPLTPLGEGLLDLSDISSLMDESEVMEGISQDVFESIEKLVNLDEQSTNATWK